MTEVQEPAGAGTEPGVSREDLEKRRGSWIRWILPALLTIAVFAALSFRLDYGQVRETLLRTDPKWFLVALLITVTFPVFSALRWQRMLGALGHELTFREGFELIMAAWPMGTITPSKAGDLVKAYYLKGRIPVRIVLGSVLAERALDVLVLLLLALFGCLLFERWALAAFAGAGFFGGLLGIFVLMRVRLPIPEKFREKLDGVLASLRSLSSNPKLLLVVVFYTVANWMASVVQVVVCYLAFGVVVPLTFAAGALPLAIFVGLLPLTLSGMGTRDSAIIFLFAAYATPEISLGVGLLYTLFGYWLPSLAGLPFMRRVLPR